MWSVHEFDGQFIDDTVGKTYGRHDDISRRDGISNAEEDVCGRHYHVCTVCTEVIFAHSLLDGKGRKILVEFL